MRILLTAVGDFGHLNPMMAVARDLTSVGHEVAVASSPRTVQTIRSAGLAPVVMGTDPPREWGIVAKDGGKPEAVAYAESYIPRAVGDLSRYTETWRPDVVVRDEPELAGMFLAARDDLPVVSVGVCVRGWQEELQENDEFGSGIDLDLPDGFRGIDSDRLARAHRGDLSLSFYPPSLSPPGQRPDPNEHFVRPPALDDAGRRGLPAWVSGLEHEQVVYATLGTSYNHTPKVFETLIEAFSGRDAHLVVTTGPDRDPGQLGPLPANVHAERYLPLSQLLPYCDLVVTHCGFATVMAALSRGLPLCLIPLGANGPATAQRCEELGLALTYPTWDPATPPRSWSFVAQPERLRPQRLRAMVVRLLTEPSFRTSARRVQAEINGLPQVLDVVPLIEQLVPDSAVST